MGCLSGRHDLLVRRNKNAIRLRSYLVLISCLIVVGMLGGGSIRLASLTRICVAVQCQVPEYIYIWCTLACTTVFNEFVSWAVGRCELTSVVLHYCRYIRVAKFLGIVVIFID